MKTLADWKSIIEDLRQHEGSGGEFERALRFARRRAREIERVVFRKGHYEKDNIDRAIERILGDIDRLSDGQGTAE